MLRDNVADDTYTCPWNVSTCDSQSDALHVSKKGTSTNTYRFCYHSNLIGRTFVTLSGCFYAMGAPNTLFILLSLVINRIELRPKHLFAIFADASKFPFTCQFIVSIISEVFSNFNGSISHVRFSAWFLYMLCIFLFYLVIVAAIRGSGSNILLVEQSIHIPPFCLLVQSGSASSVDT